MPLQIFICSILINLSNANKNLSLLKEIFLLSSINFFDDLNTKQNEIKPSNFPSRLNCTFQTENLNHKKIQNSKSGEYPKKLCIKMFWRNDFPIDTLENPWLTDDYGVGYAGFYMYSPVEFSSTFTFVQPLGNGFKILKLDLPIELKSFDDELRYKKDQYILHVYSFKDGKYFIETQLIQHFSYYLSSLFFDSIFGNFEVNISEKLDIHFSFSHFPYKPQIKFTFFSGILMVLCVLSDFVPLIFVSTTSDRINRKIFHLTINPWVSSFLIIRNCYFFMIATNFDMDYERYFYTRLFNNLIDLNLILYLFFIIFSITSTFSLIYFIFVYYFAYRTSRGFATIFDLERAERRPNLQILMVFVASILLLVLFGEIIRSKTKFDIMYLILSIGFPLVYIASSSLYPSFKCYFLWWYQIPLLCQFFLIQILATTGYEVDDDIYIFVSYHTSNLLINISWWLLFVSVVLLQRYRRPFFFLPKEYSPKCFLYENPINFDEGLINNHNCCYCLGNLTEPNSNDPKYQNNSTTELTTYIRKPCGQYAHKFCFRFWFKQTQDRICPCCDQELPIIVTESSCIPYCFLLIYCLLIFVILGLRYNLFFQSYKIGEN